MSICQKVLGHETKHLKKTLLKSETFYCEYRMFINKMLANAPPKIKPEKIKMRRFGIYHTRCASF